MHFLARISDEGYHRNCFLCVVRYWQLLKSLHCVCQTCLQLSANAASRMYFTPEAVSALSGWL